MKTITPEVRDVLALLDSRHKDYPDLSPDQFSYKLAGGYALDTPVVGDLDINESEMSMWIPIADGNARDGVGDILEVVGINTSRHIRNPIVGYDHFKEISRPIARARRDPKDVGSYSFKIDAVAKTAGCRSFFYQGKNSCGLTGNCVPGTHGQFCEELFDMAVQGFIGAGSIGYQIVQGESLPPDYSSGLPQGVHLYKTLLLECSLVVLPANASTVGRSNKYLGLVDYIGKALTGGKILGRKPSEYFVKSFASRLPAHKAQVVGGYSVKALKVPNYRQAEDPEESCQTCEAFTPQGGQFGHCRMFDTGVSPTATCDRWISAETGQERKSLDMKHGPNCKCAKCQMQYREKDHACGCKDCSQGKSCPCGTKDAFATTGGNPSTAPTGTSSAGYASATTAPSQSPKSIHTKDGGDSGKGGGASTGSSPQGGSGKQGGSKSASGSKPAAGGAKPPAQGTKPQATQQASGRKPPPPSTTSTPPQFTPQQTQQLQQQQEESRKQDRRQFGRQLGGIAAGLGVLGGTSYGLTSAALSGGGQGQGTPEEASPTAEPTERREYGQQQETTPEAEPREAGGQEAPPVESGTVREPQPSLFKPDEGRREVPGGDAFRQLRETAGRQGLQEQAQRYGLYPAEVPHFNQWMQKIEAASPQKAAWLRSQSPETLGRIFRYEKTRVGKDMSTPNDYAWDKKSLKDLRDKYREAAGRFHRSKHSIPGSIHMNLSSKDVDALRKDAEGKGVEVRWISDDGRGMSRVKLTGMDSVLEDLAKQYGKAVRKVKSLPPINNPDHDEDDLPSNNVTGTIRQDPKATQSKDPTASRERASLGNVSDESSLQNSQLGTEIDPGRPDHTAVLTARKGAKAMKKTVTVEHEDDQNALQENPKGSKKRQSEGGVQGEGQGEKIPGQDYQEGSLEADEDYETKEPAEDGPREPYGMQVIRRLHADAAGLLHEYDEFLDYAEDETVRGHVLEEIQHLISSLEKLEEIAGSHPRYGEKFKEMPLEGAEDTKQFKEASTDAVGAASGIRQEPSPDDVLAGVSGSEIPDMLGEEPSPEEAMAGMSPPGEGEEEDEDAAKLRYHKHVKNLRQKHGKKQLSSLEEKEEEYAKHGHRKNGEKALYLREHYKNLGSDTSPQAKKMRSFLIKQLKKYEEGKDSETLLQGKDKENRPHTDAEKHEGMKESETFKPGKGKKALPSEEADVSPKKARQILKDGEAHGKPLTEKQRGMFGAIAGKDKS